MPRLTTCALVSLSLVLCSCATVDYSGEVYPDTESPRVVHDLSQLSGDYETIGRAVASVPAGWGGESLQAELRKKAEDVGAHAVVLGEYRKVLVGSHLHWRYEPYAGPYDRMFSGGTFDGWQSGLRFDTAWNQPTVHYDYALELQAVFLRRASSASTK